MDSLPFDITYEILQREFAPNSVTHIYKLINRWYCSTINVPEHMRFDRNMLYYYIKHNNIDGVRWFSRLLPPTGDKQAAKLALMYNCSVEIVDLVTPLMEYYETKEMYAFSHEAMMQNRYDIIELMVKKYSYADQWLLIDAIEHCKNDFINI